MRSRSCVSRPPATRTSASAVISKKPLKGLIVGFANEQSIAWGCIQAFDALGAEMAVTYLNEKTRQYTEPLMAKINAPLYLPLDVTDEAQMDAVFSSVKKQWGGLGKA